MGAVVVVSIKVVVFDKVVVEEEVKVLETFTLLVAFGDNIDVVNAEVSFCFLLLVAFFKLFSF